jgi:hypothetical protein
LNITRDTYNTSHVEDVDEVVQHDVASEKLLPDLNTDTSHSPPELLLGEQSTIANVAGLGRKLCSLTNLLELREDNNALPVSVAVKMSEYVVSLVPSVLLR